MIIIFKHTENDKDKITHWVGEDNTIVPVHNSIVHPQLIINDVDTSAKSLFKEKQSLVVERTILLW